MKKPIISAPIGWEAPMISDVLFFQEGPGVRKWQFREEGVKLLNVGNINNGELNLGSTKLHLEESEANGKYSHFLVDEGDLLIACSGIVVSNFHNKIAFAKKEHLPLCLNTSTMRFKPLDENVINLNFFRYFLQTEIFKKQLQRLITGSAQLNFGPSHIKKIALLLPPLPTQKKIAAILDEADSYRQKTKALISKYDELTQSLFLDMFGDPVRNEKGWEKKIATEYYEVRGRVGWKGYKKTDLRQDGAIVLGATHIQSTGVIDLEKVVYLSQEKFIESPEIVVQKGDLIFVQRGNTIGKVGLVRENMGDATINPVVLIFRPVNANPLFLLYLLMNKELNREFVNSNSGSAQPMITQKFMREFMFIDIPLNLQNQFAKRVEAIEAQKAQAQKELEKAEELFGSLLQRAFKNGLEQDVKD